MSNLPLFAIATPMLCILLYSCVWSFYSRVLEVEGKRQSTMISPQSRSSASEPAAFQLLAFRLALPQLVLALSALTTYHVQIIIRISSGYPLWYWWLASLIMQDRKILVFGRDCSIAGLITRWMIMYAMIQGGLFASFLPPA